MFKINCSIKFVNNLLKKSFLYFLLVFEIVSSTFVLFVFDINDIFDFKFISKQLSIVDNCLLIFL